MTCLSRSSDDSEGSSGHSPVFAPGPPDVMRGYDITTSTPRSAYTALTLSTSENLLISRAI